MKLTQRQTLELREKLFEHNFSDDYRMGFYGALEALGVSREQNDEVFEEDKN